MRFSALDRSHPCITFARGMIDRRTASAKGMEVGVADGTPPLWADPSALQHLRQLGEVHRHAPRFVPGEQLGR